MPSPEDIAHQRNLLAIYRRNLALLLSQQARHGLAQTPLVTLNSIEEERANIKRVKDILQKWGQAVEELPDDEPPTPPVQPPLSTPTQPDAGATKRPAKRISRRDDGFENDVFISYSRADRAWVRGTLVPRLENAGLKVIVGDRDFELGVPKLVNVERAVDGSRHTLLVLTQAWHESEWAEFESLLTGTADPAGRRRKLIPLMLQESELPRRIATLEPADFTQPNEHEWQLERLIKSLAPAPKPRSTPKRRGEDAAAANISETASNTTRPAPTTASSATPPTIGNSTTVGRDQINIHDSAGAITGQIGGSVEQNYDAQSTTNAGSVIYFQGGDLRGSNITIGNSVGHDLISSNLNIGVNPSKDQLIAALHQLKKELAKAKDLPSDEITDLNSNLDAAIEAVGRAAPNKDRTVRKLTAMKEIVDGLKGSAGSALALGHLIGQVVQAAQGLVV